MIYLVWREGVCVQSITNKLQQYFKTKWKIWNDLIVSELCGDLDYASPEVRDACRGANSSSSVDNQVLTFLNQLSKSIHLYLQLFRSIKPLPQNRNTIFNKWHEEYNLHLNSNQNKIAGCIERLVTSLLIQPLFKYLYTRAKEEERKVWYKTLKPYT